MKLGPASIILLAPLSFPTSASEDSHTLALVADTPAVSISPQPPERHFYELPTLQYAFQVEARCQEDWQAESLLLNVSDTRATRGRTELGNNSPVQIQLQIPAKQIAPLALRNFCVIDEAEEGSSPDAGDREKNVRSVRVSAALSAQASLHCSREDEHRTVYVSQPLDVTLNCEVP